MDNFEDSGYLSDRERMRRRGAWWQGKGPEYDARNKGLPEERKQAFAQDVLTLDQFSKAGDVPQMIRLLEDRLSAGGRLNGDMSETQETLRLLKTGWPEDTFEAMKDIGMAAERIRVHQATNTPQEPQEWGNIYFDENNRPSGIRDPNRGFEQIPGGFVRGQAVPNTVVNVGGESGDLGAKKEAETMGANRSNFYNDLKKSALNARAQNTSLSRLKNLNAETGWGAQARMQFARVVNGLTSSKLGEETFGVDIAPMQVFRSVAETIVNSTLNEATGPQTDQDADRIRSTMAGLDKEAEANTFLVSVMKETNNRKIQQHKFYSDYYSAQTPNTLKGADAAWLEYKELTPMIGSVMDKQTGLPMMYGDFMRRAKKAKPGATQAQLISDWRKLNGVGP